MTRLTVQTEDGSTVTFTPSVNGMLRPGDVITFDCDPLVPNPDRRWWQIWKPRRVRRQWVIA